MSKYTPDYFIEKFEAIPDEQWCTGEYSTENGDAHCALGHCGFRGIDEEEQETPEGRALMDVLNGVPDINDGDDERFPQPTPKLRILAALHAVKDKLCPSSS